MNDDLMNRIEGLARQAEELRRNVEKFGVQIDYVIAADPNGHAFIAELDEVRGEQE